MNKVIFDNNCSLCISIKDKLEKLDKQNRFKWIPSNEYIKSKNINSGDNKELIEKTIIVITDKQVIITEFIACRYIISKIPIFYPVIFFLYMPFFSVFIGNKVYRLIARNRGCNF